MPDRLPDIVTDLSDWFMTDEIVHSFPYEFFHDPPYGSPIEDDFAWHIIKYLDPGVTFMTQVPVFTERGRFRVDFLFHALDGSRVVVECDGRQYHDAERDLKRDFAILGADQADVIYRVRGTDIFNHINDVLALIASHEPFLFNELGRSNLVTLCQPCLRKHFGFSESSFQYEYPPLVEEDADFQEPEGQTLHLIRRNKKWKGGWL